MDAIQNPSHLLYIHLEQKTDKILIIHMAHVYSIYNELFVEHFVYCAYNHMTYMWHDYFHWGLTIFTLMLYKYKKYTLCFQMSTQNFG